VLTVGRSADTGEVITVDNTLETFTFGSTDNINELDIVHDVTNGDGVSELELTLEVRRKLDELALGGGPCLFEVPLEGLAGVYLFDFVIGKLHGFIAIFFKSAQLRDNTRTSLDDGAWNILSISTENGSHSDFLSN
jgi:hypothetical protein